MDKELKQQIKFMSNNLNAIVTSQTMIYGELKLLNKVVENDSDTVSVILGNIGATR